jgi:ribosome biogenesis GTPase
MTVKACLTCNQQLVGTVLAVQANYYKVRLDWEAQQKLPRETEPGVRQVNSSTLGEAALWASTPLLSSSSQTPVLLCTRRTRLKKIGQQVMVGDRVIVEEPNWTDRRSQM